MPDMVDHLAVSPACQRWRPSGDRYKLVENPERGSWVYAGESRHQFFLNVVLAHGYC